MVKRFVPLLVGSVLALTGCADTSLMKMNVVEKNIQTDMALTRHDEATKEASKLEKVFVAYLYTQDDTELKSLLDKYFLNNDYYSQMSTFSYMKDTIHEYINVVNEQAENDDTGNMIKITDTQAFIKESLMVEYFLDAPKGTTEQMFYLELKNAEPIRLSVYWVGGNVIDIKTSTSN